MQGAGIVSWSCHQSCRSCNRFIHTSDLTGPWFSWANRFGDFIMVAMKSLEFSQKNNMIEIMEYLRTTTKRFPVDFTENQPSKIMYIKYFFHIENQHCWSIISKNRSWSPMISALQVLMVAEKPSVARLVSDFLCGTRPSRPRERPRERRGIAVCCPVLEFVAAPWS